jgi:hypothetical protein
VIAHNPQRSSVPADVRAAIDQAQTELPDGVLKALAGTADEVRVGIRWMIDEREQRPTVKDTVDRKLRELTTDSRRTVSTAAQKEFAKLGLGAPVAAASARRSPVTTDPAPEPTGRSDREWLNAPDVVLVVVKWAVVLGVLGLIAQYLGTILH